MWEMHGVAFFLRGLDRRPYLGTKDRKPRGARCEDIFGSLCSVLNDISASLM